MAYENAEKQMGIIVTAESRMKANRIYALVKYGHGFVDRGEIQCPGEPIGYADINTPYWKRRFLASGRLSGIPVSDDNKV